MRYPVHLRQFVFFFKRWLNRYLDKKEEKGGTR